MAKLDLSGVLGKRRKIRLITALSALLLVFFAVQMILLDNPKKPKADGLTIAADYCRVLDGDGRISDTETRCENKVLLVARGTLTLAGNHTFKWVYVDAGGIITHDPISKDDVASDGITLNSAGKNKIVSMTVDGDVGEDARNGTISVVNGGKIDVDGKGYPGATWRRTASSPIPLGTFDGKSSGGSTFGWGPGGGYTYTRDSGHPLGTNCSSGGGGGFGGAGQQGFVLSDCSDPDGPLTLVGSGSASYSMTTSGDTVSDPLNIYPGSGGGGAWYSDTATNAWSGGAGGGRIYIIARSILVDALSKITANGTQSVRTETGDLGVGGGGGAGGVVYLAVQQISFTGTSATTIGIGGGRFSGGDGKYTVTGGFDESAQTSLLSANGGDGLWRDGSEFTSGGGGGFIVVKKMSSPGGISIKKTLEPLDRNGSSAFNPYALQIGDRIKVLIDVSNINGDFVLTDERLQVPGSLSGFCGYVADSASDGGISVDSKIMFDYSPASLDVTAEQFTYECEVL